MGEEEELKNEVRQTAGYTDTSILSEKALDTAYSNAKRHIRVQKSIGQDFDWFDPETPQREEALHWWTCLFAKIQTGELDAQDLQVGAVDANSLLAKKNSDVTQWYRNARNSMRAVRPEQTFAMTFPGRDDRDYGSDDGGAFSGDGGIGDDL